MNDDLADDDASVEADIYFAAIPEWILCSRDVQPTDKIVWGVLQRFANENGTCWPGHAAIAEKANVSKRQVIVSIDRLKLAGMIEVRQRKIKVENNGEVSYQKTTNVYTLRAIPPKFRQVARWTIVGTDTAEEPAGGGAESAPGGSAESAPGGSAESAHKPEPVNKQVSSFSTLPSGSVPARAASASDADGKKQRQRTRKTAEPARADVQQLCDALVQHLVSNGVRTTRISVTEDWKKHARLLLDKDKVPLDEALETLDWCQRDDFWKSIILTIPKFRKKYDQLRLRAVGSIKPKKNSNGDYWRAIANRMDEIDAPRDAVFELGEGSDDTF